MVEADAVGRGADVGALENSGSGSVCQRSFTELVLRLFAEPALRFFTSFRMTYEGLRVTVEGFRMTTLSSVILSPSALSEPQGQAPRRGRISIPIAHWLSTLKLTHCQPVGWLRPEGYG